MEGQPARIPNCRSSDRLIKGSRLEFHEVSDGSFWSTPVTAAASLINRDTVLMKIIPTESYELANPKPSVSAVAELERNLIIERVRAGLRRARLEGRQLGRKPIEIDRAFLLRDRTRGLSLAQLAKAYKISRTSVARALKQSEGVIAKTPFLPASADIETPKSKNIDHLD